MISIQLKRKQLLFLLEIIDKIRQMPCGRIIVNCRNYYKLADVFKVLSIADFHRNNNPTCKKSLQVQGEVIIHTEHRDIAVALDICRVDNDTDIVVHKQDNSVDYIISAQEVALLKKEMRKLLEVQND